MKSLALFLGTACALTLSACSSSPYRTDWTHASLDAAAQQREMARCDEVAQQAQDEYLEANTYNRLNSAGWVNLDMSERTKSNRVRYDTYEACLRDAGFNVE